MTLLSAVAPTHVIIDDAFVPLEYHGLDGSGARSFLRVARNTNFITISAHTGTGTKSASGALDGHVIVLAGPIIEAAYGPGATKALTITGGRASLALLAGEPAGTWNVAELEESALVPA